MSEIKLNSQEWTDFVFQGKNKEYGAYELRTTSSGRHFIAIGCALLFTILVAMIPVVMKAVSDYRVKNQLVENIDTTREVSQVVFEQPPKAEPIVIPEAKPIPPIKPSIRFVPPVIAAPDEVDENVEVNIVDDVIHSGNEVSIADVIGEDTDEAISYIDIPVEVGGADETVIRDYVEQMPQFVGGQAAMLRWIADNLQYPMIAIETGKQGRVIVKFVVDKEGGISNVQVVKGVFPALDQEAIRVINKMPKWNPGKQNGKPVAVNFTIPVTFKLQ